MDLVHCWGMVDVDGLHCTVLRCSGCCCVHDGWMAGWMDAPVNPCNAGWTDGWLDNGCTHGHAWYTTPHHCLNGTCCIRVCRCGCIKSTTTMHRARPACRTANLVNHGLLLLDSAGRHACSRTGMTRNSWSQAPGGKGKGRKEGRSQGHKLADPEEGPDLGHLPPPQECVRFRPLRHAAAYPHVHLQYRAPSDRSLRVRLLARPTPQPSSSRAAPATRASPSLTRPASMPTLSLSTRSTPRRQ